MRAAAALLTIALVTALASAPSAGQEGRDAGAADASPGDASSPDGPAEPFDLLAWKQDENRALERQIARLAELAAAIEALPADLVLPPRELLNEFATTFADSPGDPDVALARIPVLEREKQRYILEAGELAATEKILAERWSAGRDSGRRDRRPADEVALGRARLAHLRLSVSRLERLAALAEAKRAYLVRTQDERVRRATAGDGEDPLQREIAAAEREAETFRREAEAARDQALSAKDQARSQYEAAISAERARLHGVEADQQQFRKLILWYRSQRARAPEDAERFGRRFEAEATAGARYRVLAGELAQVRRAALTETLNALRHAPRAPSPGSELSAKVHELAEIVPESLADLEKKRRELVDAAALLDQELAAEVSRRADLLHDRTLDLGRVRSQLFGQLGDAQVDRLVSIGDPAAEELRDEAVHVAVRALHWVDERAGQLADAGALFRDLSAMGTALWWLIEIPLVLLLLRFVLRRWESWMLACVEVVGSTMHLDNWTLFLVRLTDFARRFGPALIVLLAAVFLYWQLGGNAALPEIQIAYIFVFWIAAFRFQLRLVESIAHYLGARATARASERGEHDDEHDEHDEHDDHRRQVRGDPRAAQDTIAPGEPVPRHLDAVPAAAAAELFARTWRVVTGYLAVVVVLLDLTRFAVGPCVFYAVVTRVAWWGTLPLALYGLRMWRHWIVDESADSSTADSRVAEKLRRHSERFYGVLVVAVVLAIEVVRRLARFVRRTVSARQTTQSVMSFLFRRRVERTAAEHGRVLDEPHELPDEILVQFPSGALTPADRPFKPPPLDAIKQVFTSWQQRRPPGQEQRPDPGLAVRQGYTIGRREGSVVLVGGMGMGKSTTLGLLEETLDEPIVYCKIYHKCTEPGALMSRLAELLEFPGSFGDDEAGFTEALASAMADRDRRVIAIDDCHNFFLRKVGGFTAWEAFTRIVNASSDELFWVLSFNDTAWDYLRNIAGGVSYFHRVVHLPPWSHEDLRRLILTRMRRAGYRSNFTDLLVTRLEGVKTSTQIIRTSQGYFRLLWDFTDGNPRAACHFWLRSLVPDEDKKQVRVHLFAAPRIEELEELPEDVAFVLAAVVEHENITAGELATVCNLPLDFCRFALQFCRERGYMWQNQKTGRTKPSTQWQQSIIRFLKRKHLLYS